MNPTDTEFLARCLWPDVDWEQRDDKLYRVGYCEFGRYTKRKDFNPAKCLNDCALAWAVLEERGLLLDYMEQLLPVEAVDIEEAVDVFKATTAQHFAALVAVARAHSAQEPDTTEGESDG